MNPAPARACAAMPVMLLAMLLGSCSRQESASASLKLTDVQRARSALARQPEAIGFFRAGDYRAAAALFQEILDALPDASHAASAAAWLELDGAWAYRRVLSSINNNLGLTHLRARRPVRAEHYFREALWLFPGSRQAHVNLGHARYHSADSAGALTSFEAALSMRFSDPQLLLAAGRAARRIGNWDDARLWLRRAESLSIHVSAIDAFGIAREATYEQGMIEFALGRYEEAARAMRRSLALAHGDPKPRYMLLQILDALGRENEARSERARFEHDAAAMAEAQALLMATPDRIDAIGRVALRYEELGLLDYAWVHYAQLAARSKEHHSANRILRELERSAGRKLGR